MAKSSCASATRRLFSVITRSSAVRLGPGVGDEVLAVIKSTEIMIGGEGIEA